MIGPLSGSGQVPSPATPSTAHLPVFELPPNTIPLSYRQTAGYLMLEEDNSVLAGVMMKKHQEDDGEALLTSVMEMTLTMELTPAMELTPVVE
ncbi:hypothetical protein L6452_20931 [Arctium lappa]|uniref:Uncharacterized protein n=1 Tax=Arctium lappa TaxID=4217 RepID=A0ACB9BDL8_ARCLA|nr:hypothetical protein L6452_20931 [Arctium lappa]